MIQLTKRLFSRAAMTLLMMLLTNTTAWAENVPVTSSTTNWTSGNTYAVNSNVTINDHVTVTGSVTLSIASGCTLNVNSGITVNDGGMLTVTGSGGTLNVIGSDGKNIDVEYDTGDPTDGSAAIDGNLTVNSGTVTITGGKGGDTNKEGEIAADGGDGIHGNLTVNGGTVTVTGGIGGQAVYGSNGGHGVRDLLTVNDGNVTVYGGASGSGYSGGTPGYGVSRVTVNGGLVQITGGVDSYSQNYYYAVSGYVSYADNMVAEEKNNYETDYHLLTGNSSDAAFLRFHPVFFQEDENTWSIYKTIGWELFCDALQNNDKGFFTGKTVKLGADIEVTRMAGASHKDFTGIFDGQGHTLTVSYGTSGSPINEDNAAPFRYVEGCVIQNLHVTGHIYTSKKYAAGIAGTQNEDVSINNCLSSVTIHSSINDGGNNDGTHGGFVGNHGSGTLNIVGCAFTGKMLTTAANKTTRCGGFVGWCNSATNITNCLYAPAAIENGETEVGITESCTFGRYNKATVSLTNCYYTRTLGTAQGKQPRSITVGDTYTTLSNICISGNETSYNVSGITAYANGGIKRGSTLYYGSGDQVSLTLSHSDHANGTFQGYAANNEALSGSGNPYSLTMPDADVTIRTIWSGSPDFLTRGDGNGTSANPYKITNANDLRDLAIYVNGTGIYSNGITETTAHDCSGKYFKQTFDITLSGEWEPIGTNNHQFTGIYDGDNNKISGLTVNGSYMYAGLFGYTHYKTSSYQCVLKNIIVENCDIDVSGLASSFAGGIVGYGGDDTEVKNCRVSGTIKATTSAGGIAGYMWTVTNGHVSKINQCFTDVTVAATKKGKLLGEGATTGIVDAVLNSKNSYYHDDGSGVTAFGNCDDITYSVPVYTITGVPSGVTIDTEATVNNSGTNYYAAGNVTITVTDASKIFDTFTVSGATYSVDANKKSATVTLAASDATVSATLLSLTGSCGDNATWAVTDTNSDGTYETLRIFGTGAMESHPWTDLSYSCELTKVVIGNGVTSIGDCAFMSCSALTSIEIPTSVTSIGNSAFKGCSALSSINIPASVTSIGDGAFQNCTALETMSVTDGNKKYHSEGNCIIETATKTLIAGCKTSIIPNGVTSIGESAFYECTALTSIEIPASVTSIGDGAFWGCTSLNSVTIYAPGLDNYGSQAFRYNASGRKIYVYSDCVDTYKAGWSDYASDIEAMTNPHGTCGASGNESDLRWVLTGTSPNYTLNIFGTGAMADYNDYSNQAPWSSYKADITTVVIEDGVTSIGNYAFNGCSALTSIEIPNSVTSIGERAFQNCTALTGIEIPASVTSIGDDAFIGCNALETMSVTDGNKKYHSEGNCIIETATKTLIAGCKTSIIPNGVTSIGASAFRACTGLTSITIPNSVTSIGESAFYECTALASILVADGNTVYDSRNNCNALIETASNTLIAGCKNTIIPNDVTSIGNHAFWGCSALSSINIPASVTSIGRNAFFGCTALASILVADGNTVYDSRNNCNALIETASNTLIAGCKNTIIPNDVTSIGERAFQNCTALTGIEIPASVTSIGNYAFENCTGLTSVTIYAPSLTTYGAWAFDDNADGRKIYVYSDCVDTYKAGWSDYTSDIEAMTNPHGTCGASGHESDLRWVLTGTSPNYTLNIFGTGAMADYNDYSNQAPWSSYKADITTVVIENGVTSIGDWAFYECTALTSIEIPASMTSIGDWAFVLCSALTSVTIYAPELTEYGYDAFYENASGRKIYVYSDCVDTYKAGWSDYADDILPISDGTCGTGVYYSYDSNRKTLNIFGTGAMESHPWTDLSYRCELTKVVIGNGVTSIGDYAFDGCSSLTNVTIYAPELTKYGSQAFRYNADGRKIYVYSDCVDTYKAGWSDYADDIVGFSGTCGTGVYYSYDSNRKTLNIFGTGAMADYNDYSNQAPWNSYKENITTVIIENGVTSIGKNAFNNCEALTSVTIPNSVTSIVYNAFQNCTALTSITIPNSVTSIGNGAFAGCISLTTVTIPTSVTSIGERAFQDCTALTGIEIPASVTSIGESAFECCSALTSIEIPTSVTSIGYNAFSGCTALASILVASGNTVYDSRNNCNALIETASNTLIQGCKTSVIPTGVTSIGDWAFNNCEALTSITIPASVTKIGIEVFVGCTGLESMSVASGNTVYDSRNNCNALIETASNTLIAGCKNTIIPNDVTSIGEEAFYECTGLTSVTIPNSVTSIGNYAFACCEALTSITIPASVTSIGYYAFAGCEALTSIEIPNSVTSIGDDAFSFCFGLTSVTIYAPSLTTYGAWAFDDNAEGRKIYVFSDCVDTYKANWSDYASDILPIKDITLADAADNSATILAASGKKLNVTLNGRTLYKDGAWNTLCLPFNVTLAGSPLEGATVMKLIPETSNLTDGTLTLNFEDETTTMTAGTPYIIKWTKADGYDAANPATRDLQDPVFLGVTINNSASTEVIFTGGSFQGTYSPIAWDTENQSILFLGDNNKLFWPQPDGDNMPHLNAFRAYFELIDVNGVREIKLNYGDEEITAVANSQLSTLNSTLSEWYDMQGRKVSKPTKKGMYIHKGSKVVIK